MKLVEEKVNNEVGLVGARLNEITANPPSALEMEAKRKLLPKMSASTPQKRQVSHKSLPNRQSQTKSRLHSKGLEYFAKRQAQRSELSQEDSRWQSNNIVWTSQHWSKAAAPRICALKLWPGAGSRADRVSS